MRSPIAVHRSDGSELRLESPDHSLGYRIDILDVEHCRLFDRDDLLFQYFQPPRKVSRDHIAFVQL
jgi:hypothetical protein